jgi:predicted lipid-binding transport protein (Tim44 family)
MGGMMAGMSFMMAWMVFVGLIFLAAVIIFVVLLARWFARQATLQQNQGMTAPHRQRGEAQRGTPVSEGKESASASPVYEPFLVQYPHPQEAEHREVPPCSE